MKNAGKDIVQAKHRLRRGRIAIGLTLLLSMMLYSHARFVPSSTTDSSPVDNAGTIPSGSITALSPSGKTLVVANAAADVADAPNAGSLSVYVRDEKRWKLVVVLTASDPSQNARFGEAVSLTDDVIVAGSPGENNQAGSFSVFVLQDGAWKLAQKISGTEPGDLLGCALALDGKFLLAGSKGFSNGTGLARLYESNQDGLFVEQSKLSTNVPKGGLGSSVAIGHGFVLVGAETEQAYGASIQGSAYLWKLADIKNGITGGYSRLDAKVAFQDGTTFGRAVAIVSERIVCISAIGKSIFVFKLENDSWALSDSQIIAPPENMSFGKWISFQEPSLFVGSEEKLFVFSIKLVKDEGDNEDILISEVSLGDIASNDGSVSVLVKNTDNVTARRTSPLVTPVFASATSKSQKLGYQVAFFSDIAIISAPFCVTPSTPSSCDGGFFLTYKKSPSNSWIFHKRIRNPFTNRDNKFGRTLEVSNSYIVVSTPDAIYDGVEVGITVLYRWDAGQDTFVKDSTIVFRKLVAKYDLGSALTNIDDITVIGMPEFDVYPSASSVLANAGGVHVYRKRTDGKWGARVTFTAPNPSQNERFGHSVSLHTKTRVAVSNNPANAAAQAVYIYQFANGAWGRTQTLSSTSNAGFGWKIGYFGNELYVSAVNDASDAGAILVYQVNQSGVHGSRVDLRPTTAVAGEKFGYSFASDGTKLIVGAKPCNDEQACSVRGAAYTFTKNSSNQWSQEDRFQSDVADGSDGYGYDVAIKGNTALVSAPFRVQNNRQGAAYFIQK